MNEKKFHVGVKALVMNYDEEILLLKINPKELKDNKHGVYWDIPGGRIKEGDSVEQTLRKEIEEELGITDIEIVRPFDTTISNIEIPVGEEKFGLVLSVYLCNADTNDVQLSDEHTDYKWASIEEAKKLLSVKFPKSFIDKLNDL